MCQRDLGTKAHQTGSRYQAVVFISKAGSAALFFYEIPEPCLFLSTGLWVTKQMEQDPPSLKPQEEPGYAPGRGRVSYLPRPGLVGYRGECLAPRHWSISLGS